MSCRTTYDPCLDGKLNQIGSYASVARQSAESATTSATQAAASAASAQSNATLVQNLYDDFSEKYLGSFAVPPLPPITEGALYYNTVSNGLFVWNGTAWISADFNEFTQFTATGTTTARNLVNRMADFVSPLDFGADPTGVVDSTTFIQNALNTGKRVFLPKGTYKISSVLTVPSGGGLVGDQSATLFATNAGFNNTSLAIKYTSNSMVVNCSGLTSAPFTPTENILIHGIKIQYEFLDGTSVDGIVARNCNNIEISNVEIFGFSNTKALRIASIKDSFITNNYIHDCSIAYTGWLPLRPQITGIEIDNDRVNSIFSNRVNVTNNVIKNLTLSAPAITAYGYETDGININSGSNSLVNSGRSPMLVVSNNIIDTVGEGIDTFGSRAVISNNNISNTYNFGIKMIHGASLNVISGNNIFNTGIAGITINGSNIANAGDTTKNIITGNFVENINYLGAWTSRTDKSGILIDNVGFSPVLYKATNNLISNNQLDGTGDYGIFNRSLDSDRNVCSNNNITSQPTIAWVKGINTPCMLIRDAVPTLVTASLSADQIVSALIPTKITYDLNPVDTRGEFDTATNTWTCQIPGVYSVFAQIRFSGGVSGTTAEIRIYRNGTDVNNRQVVRQSNQECVSIQALVPCTDGDTIAIYYNQSVQPYTITGLSELTFMSISQA
jgi:hypothetical protein